MISAMRSPCEISKTPLQKRMWRFALAMQLTLDTSLSVAKALRLLFELHAIESAACPGAGACGGQFTANTMATVFEVMGISPAGGGSVPRR